MRLLVVEDEAHLARGIADNLAAEGFAVDVAADGEAALRQYALQKPDVIVLDVMLPKLDGYQVCERLRQTGSQVPILFLSAKNRPEERVKGLSLGGDDYLGKPFDLQELLLRVRRLVKRQPAQLLVFQHCQIDLANHVLTKANGSQLMLSRYETNLLRALQAAGAAVVDRDELMRAVWEDDVYPSSRALASLVDNIRVYLEDEAEALQCVPGVGYVLKLPA